MMRYITKTDLYIVSRYSGVVMICVGLMCLFPLLIDLIYFEFNYACFIIPGVFSVILGYICMKALDKYSNSKMRLKHGMMISSIAWMWVSVIGGVVISLATGTDFLNGIFESTSALTGTGITMFDNVEILPHSILYFRAFEQWVGGLGVVVMMIGILTRPGTASAKLYQSEAREERLKPSVKTTLKKTIEIYLIYTIIGIILYLLAGMPAFDSVCTTFCMIATGGMSIKNANIGYYHNDLIYLISIILMVLGATSFLAHYKIIKTKGRSLIQDLQFKTLICIITFVTIILYLASHIIPIDILFTVTSAITTTGANVQLASTMAGWPSFVLLSLMILMLIGGSSGSTVGAIKLFRIITYVKTIYRHIKEILSPDGRIIPIKISGRRISEKEIGKTGNFITLYLIIIAITWLIFCFYGYPPFDSLFSIISLQGNNGLDVGVLNNTLHPVLKAVSILDMWVGRLEIYPILVLFRGIFEIFKK